MTKKKKCPICKRNKKSALFVKADEKQENLLYVRCCKTCLVKKRVLLEKWNYLYRPISEKVPREDEEKMLEMLKQNENKNSD